MDCTSSVVFNDAVRSVDWVKLLLRIVSSPDHSTALPKPTSPYLPAEVKQMHKDKKADMWIQRPLSEQLLQYAAKDIQLISMLCTKFIQKGWIPTAILPYQELLQTCARYISAHIEQGKSAEMDPFRPTGLMPLDVLLPPSGFCYKCAGCNRTLSATCYAIDTDGFYRYRRPRCNLCHVLAMKYRVRGDTKWHLI